MSLESKDASPLLAKQLHLLNVISHTLHFFCSAPEAVTYQGGLVIRSRMFWARTGPLSSVFLITELFENS